MKGVFFLITTGLLLLSLVLTAFAGEKVAVLDFKSILAPPELGIAVAEILRTELIGLGNYTVIERGMLEQLIQEQELQLTGVVDSETAVEIGKLAGAKLVVIGSIVKTGTVYTINSRFIDVETGIAKVGQNIRGQGEDQISNMVHQLALIISGKTVATEETVTETDHRTSPQETTRLFSFESQREVQQWRPTGEPPKSMALSAEYVTDGEYSLHVIFPKKTEFPELDTASLPRDWSAYQILAFDVYYNTEQSESTWTLGVRIDDHESTPANQKWFAEGYIIHPGLNTIKIYIEDIGQSVDLKKMKRLMLFTNALENDVEVFFDDLRFETGASDVSAEPFVFSFEQMSAIKDWRPTSDDRRISIKQSKKHPTEGANSLRVKLPKASSKNEYPGIITDKFPRNWSQYTQLAAELYLENEHENVPINLVIRIDDVKSSSFENRFNWDIPLQAGTNTIRVPITMIGSSIDMTKIKDVYFFLGEPQEKTTLYFDNIRLE